MTILEQDLEESEMSVNAVNIESNEARMFPKRQIEEKTEIINKYKRIDQMTLNRVGLNQKQVFQEKAISDVFNLISFKLIDLIYSKLCCREH